MQKIATLARTSGTKRPCSNKLTLRNILNGRNNLSTPELRATVAAMSDEQRDDALVFLECNTEELAGLPDGRGIQAVANVKNLLDYLSTVSHYRGYSRKGYSQIC